MRERLLTLAIVVDIEDPKFDLEKYIEQYEKENN